MSKARLVVSGLLLLAIEAALPVVALAQDQQSDPAANERSANQGASALYSLLGGDKSGASATAKRDKAAETQSFNSASGATCSNDGKVYAEVSSKNTTLVKNAVKLIEKGAQLRDVARLVLPCDFQIDSRYGAYLVLKKGTEFRSYRENNPFGFAPPFGFSAGEGKSYVLNYNAVDQSSLHLDDCLEKLPSLDSKITLCSSFGSATAFFGAKQDGDTTHISHYVTQGTGFGEDFKVADIAAKVESIFFIHSVDTPGGSITLLLDIGGKTYRAYIDTSNG